MNPREILPSSEESESSSIEDLETSRELDEATHEPGALIEQTGDIQTSETIETTFMELLESNLGEMEGGPGEGGAGGAAGGSTEGSIEGAPGGAAGAAAGETATGGEGDVAGALAGGAAGGAAGESLDDEPGGAAGVSAGGIIEGAPGGAAGAAAGETTTGGEGDTAGASTGGSSQGVSGGVGGSPSGTPGIAPEEGGAGEATEEKVGGGGKSSFGSETYDPQKEYSGVQMTQGEVLQDDDWNEESGDFDTLTINTSIETTQDDIIADPSALGPLDSTDSVDAPSGRGKTHGGHKDGSKGKISGGPSSPGIPTSDPEGKTPGGAQEEGKGGDTGETTSKPPKDGVDAVDAPSGGGETKGGGQGGSGPISGPSSPGIPSTDPSGGSTGEAQGEDKGGATGETTSGSAKDGFDSGDGGIVKGVSGGTGLVNIDLEGGIAELTDEGNDDVMVDPSQVRPTKDDEDD